MDNLLDHGTGEPAACPAFSGVRRRRKLRDLVQSSRTRNSRRRHMHVPNLCLIAAEGSYNGKGGFVHLRGWEHALVSRSIHT